MRALASLFLLAIGACAARATDLDVAGMDRGVDQRACASRLLEWVKSLGIDAELRPDGRMLLLRERQILASPIFRKEGIDCIVVYVTFAGPPENAGDAELARVVNQVNADQVAAQVSVKPDGGIQFAIYILFDDKLSPGVFRKFVAHACEIAEAIVGHHPGLARRIK